MNNRKNIEDIYPLSPLQQGLLHHAIHDQGEGLYLEQFHFSFEGNLDTARLKKAWQQVVDRHPILRTGFLWEGLKQPLQVVHRQVQLPIREWDWSTYEPERVRAEIAAHLDRERQEGLPLQKAPLMALTLIKCASTRYELLWTHHHLLLDGWSVSLVLDEVFQLAMGAVEPQALPRRRPYRAYIQHILNKKPAAAKAFWQTYLQGMESATPLPFGKRPLGQGMLHRERVFHLDAALSDQLQDLVRRHGVTLNTLFQGIWGLLLARHARVNHVVFGSTVSGRLPEVPGIESMIGLFINTLPVSVRLDPQLPFFDWLKQLHKQSGAMRTHEDNSLVDIRDYAGLDGDRSLFHSVMVFENYPVAQRQQHEEQGDLRMTNVQVHERASFPLALVAGPGETLLARVLFDGRLYDEAEIDELWSQLSTLFQQVAATPTVTLDHLSLSRPSVTKSWLEDWNQPSATPDPETTAVTRFQAMVAAHPDSPALILGSRTLTYDQFNQRVNQLAHYLRAQGVQRETPVALAMDRSFHMIIGIWAVLKAGGIFQCLDLKHPASRLKTLVDETKPLLLLTRSEDLQQLPDLAVPTVVIDDSVAEGADYPRSDLPLVNHPDDLGYAIATSGSTGTPKSVMITHRGLVNIVQISKETFQLTSADRILQFASFSFDASVWEMAMSLLNGATLVLAEPGDQLTGTCLTRYLADFQITLVTLPPSVLAITEPTELPALRTVISAGEACSNQIVERWGKDRAFFNAYGPSEITIIATTHLCSTSEAGQPPLGQPIANTQVYLLDHQLRPLPPGVIGDVFLAGQGLARGYLNRPKRTAQSFLPNPFSDQPGDRLYRTGDLAQFTVDRRLLYAGREDHQVKLRGYRIELGDIEAHLRAHTTVRDALVLASEGQQLLAFVIPEPHQEPASSLPNDQLGTELTRVLRDKLPGYMVPNQILFLTSFPLTVNGKIDKKALTSNIREQPKTKRLPKTASEELLLGLCTKVLKHQDVHITDNFFKAGGHSLSASQLVSRIRETFSVEISIADIFTSENLAALAGTIDRVHRVESQPLVAVNRTDNLPLSLGQQRLWFLDRFQPGNPAYHIPNVQRWQGELNREALGKALGQVITKHEALRTSFPVHDRQPVQVIQPPFVPVVAWESLPNPEDETLIRDTIAAEILKPFDLGEGPLIRVRVFALSARDHLVVTTVHHIIADGWSMGILLSEWAQAYNHLCRGDQGLALPHLPLQYADFAVWQRHHVAGTNLEQSLAYWQGELTGTSVLRLPLDLPRPEVQTAAGAHMPLRLPPDLTAQLKAFHLREQATLFMTLLAGFQVLLARYSGQSDFAIGTPSAGRDRGETEAMIGFFINTLVMRAQLTAEDHFKSLLRKTVKTALGAYQHQMVPFDQLVDLVQAERDMAHHPIYQVMFNLQNNPQLEGDLAWDGLTPVPQPYEMPIAQVDLSMDLFDAGDEIIGHIEYNTDLFHADTIERMVGHYEHLLRALLAQPERPVSTLSPLSEPEHQQLVQHWNHTQCQAEVRSVMDRIEERARLTPDAIALRHGQETLTYAQLMRRVTDWADLLREDGYGPHSVIALGVHRGLDYATAVLAIMRLGALCVPLDANFPTDRLQFMIEDAGAQLLISTRDLQTSFPAAGIARLSLDDPHFLDRQPRRHVPPTVDPEWPAYLIFTSGSTGRPKGVTLPYRALANFCAATVDLFGLHPGDRVLHFSSISFDVSLEELLPTLCTGGQVVFRSEALLHSFEVLQSFTTDHELTILDLPTAYWQDWVNYLVANRLAIPASLRLMIVGGEKVSPATLQTWQGLAGSENVTWLQAYGPTETTIASTYHQPNGPVSDHVLPIGRPILNTDVYILDAHMAPQPIGVAGEIYIGGEGLALGYHGRPALTGGRFVPHPYSDQPGARLYKTGDRVRFCADGTIEFLGRTDNQVKLRGFRIELDEVAAALRAHPHISEAVVVLHKPKQGHDFLAAYVQSNALDQEAGRTLREFLQGRLPHFMVPSVFTVLPSFPLNASGKINRQALPAPLPPAEIETRYEPPQGDTEERLAAIWGQVLKRARVGRHDHFFELGGNSLLVIQVNLHIGEAFGTELPLKDFFQAPTLCQLAAVLEELKSEQDQVGELGELMAMLEGLSDEEAALMADSKQHDRN